MPEYEVTVRPVLCAQPDRPGAAPDGAFALAQFLRGGPFGSAVRAGRACLRHRAVPAAARAVRRGEAPAAVDAV